MQDNKMDVIRMIFPERLCKGIYPALREITQVQEIRIRVNQPLFVRTQNRDYEIGKDGTWYLDEESDKQFKIRTQVFLQEDLFTIVNHLFKNSIFAYQEEIKSGFITLEGGHRVGISGQVVLDENGNVKTIKYINYIHIRIAHDVKGISKKIIDEIFKEDGMRNCLIISPPGFGKTTLLRDMIREISNGDTLRTYKQCCLIDERGELAGVYRGIPQMDVGRHTDVYSDCPKQLGMIMAIRSMGPEVIGIDELGGKEDILSLRYAMRCGCHLIATIHGTSLAEIYKKAYIKELIEEGLFQTYVVIQNHKHESKVFHGDEQYND